MEHKFTVLIDGGYYYDNEEEEFDISLTDEDMATLRKLVSEFDGELAKGLIPILEKGPEELYHKFYDVIYPYVWYVFFERDGMFEPQPEDEDRDFTFQDVQYLMEKYYDSYCLDDAYICYIPEDLMPPKIKLTKDSSKDDILRYIRRWNPARNEVFGQCSFRGIETDSQDAIEKRTGILYDMIEKRLVPMVEKAIAESDEETLAKDAFNPLEEFKYSITAYEMAKEIVEEFEKRNTAK